MRGRRSTSALGLRIFLLLSSFCILPSAFGQIQFINQTSLTTNVTTSSANITIPGVCSNAPYFVTNYNNVIVGDTIAAAFAKLNSDLVYCSNEFVLLVSLPNQINTNWQSYSVGLSNFVANVELTNSQTVAGLNLVSSNFTVVSNNFAAISNRFVIVSNNFVIVSNNFAGVSNSFTRFVATNALGSTNIFALGGNVGISNASPAYTLDVNGPIHFTGGRSSANVSMLLRNDGVGTMAWVIYNGTNAQPVQFSLAGGAGFFRNTGGGVVYFDSSTAKIGNDANSAVVQVSGGNVDIVDQSGSGLHLDGSGNFSIDRKMTSDSGSFYSDGSGNVTCLSLTQTSDLNTKTNITPLDPATVLQKLVAIPVFRWSFRDYTTTNSSSFSTNTFATNSSSSFSSSSSITTPTNLIIQQHTVSTTPHFGPMAQDWSAHFGGRTNAISVIDMQGLLLAGEQALAQQSGIFTNANGAKFHLVVNSETNGFVFVPE